FLRRLAANERKVFSHRLVRAEQIGQGDEGGFVFGEQDDAARIEVEPVRVHQISQPAFARPRLGFGNAGVQQPDQIRTVGVVAVGRREQSSGFVERQQMPVFEQNGNFPKL